MYAWEAIQKTVDYMEEHLEDDLTVEELAALAALSPFYYQRLFSRLVKKPVREYIKLRRLARACQALAGGGRRVLDIALDCGFSSHETFTRAFRAAFDLTPEQYRERLPRLNQFDKPDLRLHYVLADAGAPLICDGLVLETRRERLAEPVHFLGLCAHIPIAGQMPLGEATGVDLPGALWDRFHREKLRLPRLPGGREVGVAFVGDAPPGSFTYYAGAEVAAGAACDGYHAWTLPAREYVVCGFEAESFEELTTAALNKAVKYSRLWLAQHDLTMEEYSPELYPAGTPEVPYMELWMPANPAAGR